MRIRHTLLVAILLAPACAGGTRAPGAANSNTVTRAELAAAGSVNALEALQRLRPAFLRVRGPTSILNTTARTRPVVFVDATEYGEIESLSTFPTSRLEEIRFYSGSEAVTRFGSTYGAGVIQVKMRVQ
jgi:hypothetical protein